MGALTHQDTGKHVVAPVDGVTPEWGKDLTPRELMFVQHYLVDLNKNNAARAIGREDGQEFSISRGPEYVAREILKRPRVQHAIWAALEQRGITQFWIVDLLVQMATANIFDFVDLVYDKSVGREIVQVKPLDQIPEHKRWLVQELVQGFDKDGNPTGVAVKLKNDSAAIRMLMKILRMEVDRHEISGPNGGAIQTEDLKARLFARMEDVRVRVEGAPKLVGSSSTERTE